MDKRWFYGGIALRVLIGFILLFATFIVWEFNNSIINDNGADQWLVFFGVPLFLMMGLVMLVGADILWLIYFTLWIIKQRKGKDDEEEDDDKIVYLP